MCIFWPTWPTKWDIYIHSSCKITIVSRRQTAFLLLYLDGKKRVWWTLYIIFVLQIPTFWGFYAWLLTGAKGQKWLIDWWEWCNHPVLPAWSKATQYFSVLQHQSEAMHKIPKQWGFWEKNYTGRSPDHFSSRPIKKKKKRSGYARLKLQSAVTKPL